MSDPIWLAQRIENGEVWFRIGRVGNRLIADWSDLCTLTCDPDGSNAELIAAPGAHPIAIEKVKRGAAYALVESLRGKVALHAGAVVRGDRALIIVGRNHAGKSTATADLCIHGAELLADDIAALAFDGKRPLVEPTERHHWLGAGSRAALAVGDPAGDEIDKHPHLATSVAVRAVPLAAVVSLEFKDAPPRLTPISGLDALAELVPSVVRFVFDDPVRSRQEMNALAELTEAVPFFRLTRPRDLQRIREAGMILEDLIR